MLTKLTDMHGIEPDCRFGEFLGVRSMKAVEILLLLRSRKFRGNNDEVATVTRWGDISIEISIHF